MPAALVGPLFFWDVVRLARRGRGTALRVAYGAVLLAALAGVYAEYFGTHALLDFSGDFHRVSLKQQAKFAHDFAIALMLAQNVAVLVLVPPYLAGAIAEEKEKKTLDLLFTTALTDREIVLGKMLGRLAHVAGVLLAALPVLALAQLWGGVDGTVLLANFAATALTLLSVGGLCLFCSALTSTTLSALVVSYCAAALLGVGGLCPAGDIVFSPLGFPFSLEGQFGKARAGSQVATAARLVFYYATVHGAIGLTAVGFAVALLRSMERRPAPTDPPPLAEKLPWLPPLPDLPPEVDGVYHPSPPVGDDPLFWKEVLHRTGPEAPRWHRELGPPALFVFMGTAVAWTIVGLIALSPKGEGPGEALNKLGEACNMLLRAGSVFFLTITCVAVGFRAAGSVVRERARGTLDALLTLPLSGATILRAKWLGSLLRVRYLLYLVAAACVVALATGGLHPLVVPLFVFIVAAHLTFVASLGVWVSVRAGTILRAHFLMALWLALFFGAGWIVWCYTYPRHGGGVDDPAGLTLIGLTPWRAWWALTFPLLGPEPLSSRDDAGAGFLAVVATVYLVAAGLMWRAAVRRFAKR